MGWLPSLLGDWGALVKETSSATCIAFPDSVDRVASNKLHLDCPPSELLRRDFYSSFTCWRETRLEALKSAARFAGRLGFFAKETPRPTDIAFPAEKNACSPRAL